jgi:D-alanine transaminase
MWVYLNGEILEGDKAKISPLDRSSTFGDGVYEVIPSYNKKLFLFDEHLARLKSSLNKTFIPIPSELNDLKDILKELHTKNNFINQSFYIQISRGVQNIRNHQAAIDTIPTVFITSQDLETNPFRENPCRKGLKVRLEDDIRWQRCDIKTTALMGNILSMHNPSLDKVDEVILCKNGLITEGSKSNIFLVKYGSVYTPSLNNNILPGITRNFIIKLLRENNTQVIEENIPVKDIYEFDEVWLTSSTKEIQPVDSVDSFKFPEKKFDELIWKKALNLFNYH